MQQQQQQQQPTFADSGVVVNEDDSTIKLDRGAAIIGVIVIVAMIVLGAMSSKGMYQLGCSKNLSAAGFFLYNLLNTFTFGIFGLVMSYNFRDTSFQLKKR